MGDGRLLLESRVDARPFTVVRHTLVKPSEATPVENRWLAFSSLDRIWTPFYTQTISAYTLDVNVDVAERLQESLQRALTLFYPLAGRVVTTGVEKPGILCNDAGAPFVEATIDATLEEFLCGENFQPSFLLSGMAEAGLGVYPRLPADNPAGRPALILQVTRFRCGGITLAANWAHPVADGFSGFHFLSSWAELARGEDVSLLPAHDRALVKPRAPLVLRNPRRAGHPEHPPGTVRSEAQTTPTVRVVEISKRDVEEMKREVGDAARLSRVCVVSAYLWRAIVQARALPAEDQSRFWILVEGRKRMGLPEGYFGNAIGARYVTTSVRALCENPLVETATLVQRTIQVCTAEWYQDLVDWVEAGAGDEYPGLVLGADHECGSSWQNRFPYYELDFGFGKPVSSMRNASAAWDGLFVFLPSARGADDYSAMLHADPEVMKTFLPMVHNLSRD